MKEKQFPIVVDPETKDELARFRAENQDNILGMGNTSRRYVSWDKTIRYLLHLAKKKR
jgi:hypothetical protein